MKSVHKLRNNLLATFFNKTQALTGLEQVQKYLIIKLRKPKEAKTRQRKLFLEVAKKEVVARLLFYIFCFFFLIFSSNI